MDVISGRFLIDGELKETSVGIEDGRIVTIGKIIRGGDSTYEFRKGVILPGFIDPHVHFRDPGFTNKEDFGTGTRSAIFGGVTCVLDMPNTRPAATDPMSLREKRSAVRSKAFTDYGLFAAITPGCDVARLAPMAVGFKLFMGSTTGDILVNDDATISEAFGAIARTGKVVSVHAEDDSMILRSPEEDGMDHLRNRPVQAEWNAVSRLSRHKGMRINICHCTDAGTLGMAAAAGFTTEVTAHHLLFCAEDRPTAEFKVNPPLRTRDVRDALYRGFAEGRATMFGSDHAPHTVAEKSQDYHSAPSGMPGVETTMPIFMELVRRELLPLRLVSAMGSLNPARVFGLNKGRIAVGCDADLAVFGSMEPRTLRSDDMHSRCGYTPYEGMEALFPTDVFLRGERQMEDSEFIGTNMGVDVVAGDRLLRGVRQEGGVPAAMRALLPLPAGGAPRGEAVFQVEASEGAGQERCAGQAFRLGDEAGPRPVRIPRQEEMLHLRQQDHLLQAVPLPFPRQRQDTGGAGPLLPRRLDWERG